MNNLSIINIIPKEHLTTINLLAELYGCGADNISVPLYSIETNEITHYCCHSFWKPQDYATFKSKEVRDIFLSNYDQDIVESINVAIENLYEYIVDDGVITHPIITLETILVELGLKRNL